MAYERNDCKIVIGKISEGFSSGEQSFFEAMDPG
jgi:hypothetical protein